MQPKEIIKSMTLLEKAAFLSGKNEWETRDVPRLDIPSVFCADGPNGVRKQVGAGDHLGINPSVPATCFPTAAAMANSWDEELEEQVGEALGEEAMEEGVNILLGPGLNIKRNPLCGRNFEYFSEDPYLSGKMAAAFIRGVQKKGAAACAKHFAVNSQELRRMAMNAVVDERTLREIYLTGFEIAVKEGGAKTVMSSYNEVNGIYANENRHLLKEILRDEWGFTGAVITDWGGSNDHCAGVKNGSALEMPTPGLDAARELIAGVESGKISETDIDERVEELLTLVLELSGQAQAYKKTGNKQALFLRHHELARKASEGSIVLLKNEERILPLKKDLRIAVIGDFAFTPRYQGAGSSMVNSTRVDSVKEMLASQELLISGVVQGYQRDGREDEAMKKEAVDLARASDVVLFFFGLNEQSETEGLDREHLRIPQNQIGLLQELARANENIVGIISTGSVIEMPWHHHLKGMLHASLSGQAGAEAILNVLTGKVNPSGKLAETYLRRYEDTPSYHYFPAQERNSEYREGIYVGYRYFDTTRTPVTYPFGFGLSYTNFTYRDLQVDSAGVTFFLKNTGNMDGAEIVQMYVRLPEAKVFRPVKELKGFCKVFLKAGEEQKVRISFDDKTFRYWNTRTECWEVEEGDYHILIGASVEDIRLEGNLQMEGTTRVMPYYTNRIPAYVEGKIQKVSDREFETVLGRAIPDGSWKGELGLNDALCQMYYAKSGLARLICRKLAQRMKKADEKGTPDLNMLFQYNMPFRAIAKMTGGMVSMEMAEGLVVMVNGRFCKGFCQIIAGFFRNRRLNRDWEARLRKGDGTYGADQKF